MSDVRSLFERDGGRIAADRERFETGWALLQPGLAPEALARKRRGRYGF